MSGFKGTNNSGIVLYRGDLTCDDAHAALLDALIKMGTPFLGGTQTISLSQQGNLGEFITLHVARTGPLLNTEKFAHNAIQPLAAISGAGIDLMYVYFDPLSEAGDLLYIQEVKTTLQNNLNLFGRLVDDTEKLFSVDINLTLQSRIQFLANSFEIERNSDAHAERVIRLGAKAPKECKRVRLIPTGVHDAKVTDPVQKMLAVRSSITAFGWDSNAIEPWAIALTDLEDRLLRLSRGQP